MIKKIPNLNSPKSKVDWYREIGCEGDGEQSARVTGEDASAGVERIAPRTGFAGSAVAAAVGGAVRLHQLFMDATIARFMLA